MHRSTSCIDRSEAHNGRVIHISRESLIRANLDYGQLIFYSVPDESMAPRYAIGGVVGFNRAAIDIIDGEEYAYIYKGIYQFKTLKSLPDKKLLVSSYSNQFADKVVPENAITILGHLVFYQMIKPTG